MIFVKPPARICTRDYRLQGDYFNYYNYGGSKGITRQTPPTRFELVTWKLTVSRATAAPQGNTNGGVATPLIYLELTKLLIFSASC